MSILVDNPSKLAKIMIDRAMGQKELLELLDKNGTPLDNSVLSRDLRLNHPVKVDRVLAYCNALGVTPNDIIKYEDAEANGAA